MSDPIVTLREILTLNPCAPQREILRKFIPAEGIPVNATTIAAAEKAGLDVVWYAAWVAGRPDVLRVLASARWLVRAAVAHRCPSDCIGALASDPDPRVRAAVVDNMCMRSQPALLGALASDPDVRVRRAVARNDHTPADALLALASDPDTDVYRAVSGNPQTPPDVLRARATDPDYLIRWLVAANRSTPRDVLQALASDPVLSVASEAVDTLTALEGPC